MKLLKNEKGFSAVEVSIIVFILAVVGLVGYRVVSSSKDDDLTNTQPISSVDTVSKIKPMDIRWQGTADGGWKASDNQTPECPNPILSQSPVDTTKVTEVLYPGQYRGTHYKAHGGFSFSGTTNNGVEVKLPMDMRLVGATRYLESSEIQYLLTFEHPCGIQVRFDHLLELSPEFAAIAATLPEPKADDTRSVPQEKAPEYSNKIHKAGTLVAVRVGHTKARSAGFDFGVYDLREPNEISKNQQWAAVHKNESGQTFYGLCWIEMLPSADEARLKKVLPLATDDRGASDYCDFDAGGSTLQYNGGQPVINHTTPNIAR